MDRNKILNIVVMGMALLALASCGKKNNPNPNPAPVPTNPNPGGGGYYGGGCGNIGAIGRLVTGDTNPYVYSDLFSQYGTDNSLQLSVYFSNYAGVGVPGQNIVATGQFNFGDITRMFPSANQQSISNFCVSSGGINGGAPTPGTIDNFGGVRFNIRGSVQLPYYDPFGYPAQNGGLNYVQVQLMVGYSCQTRITASNRLVGCVDVQIGRGASIRYRAQ